MTRNVCSVRSHLFRTIAMLALAVTLPARAALAQITPAPGFPPPDDNPSVRVGGVLFGDYTRTFAPEIVDADDNSVEPHSFNIMRAYLNVTGQVNHLIQFRVTPDVAREQGTGSSLNGSMVMRLKYGYAQFNFDDWLWRGTYARAGMIQTAYVDFEESVYRFQGPDLGYAPLPPEVATLVMSALDTIRTGK
jgi:hypothetical protein